MNFRREQVAATSAGQCVRPNVRYVIRRSQLGRMLAIGPEPSREAGAAGTPARETATPRIPAAPFGQQEVTPVQIYTLANKNGLVERITNFGAIVTELHVPDRDGRLANVVLGFENLDGYLAGHPYFGAILGRVANRIRNAEFALEGTRYRVAANDTPHHLHGGRTSWDEVVWTAKTGHTAEGP